MKFAGCHGNVKNDRHTIYIAKFSRRMKEQLLTVSASEARFRRRILPVPNLLPIWVDPNNKIRQLSQTSNLIYSDLIAKIKEALFQATFIADQNDRKNARKTNCGNEELVFLASAIKEGRRRRLQMQLALNYLFSLKNMTVNCLLSNLLHLHCFS